MTLIVFLLLLSVNSGYQHLEAYRYLIKTLQKLEKLYNSVVRLTVPLVCRFIVGADVL